VQFQKTARSPVLFCGASLEILKMWHWHRVGEQNSWFWGWSFGWWTPSKENCFRTRKFTCFEIIPPSILGCDQQNLENFLSDSKWSGRRLAHVFADGWSTASHVRKMILSEAPTGTLLFCYKDMKQEIVHTLLLEEYHSVSKMKVIIMEKGLKCDLDSRKEWIFGSGSLLGQRFRRRREEMAWKQKIIETSLIIVMIT